MKTNDPAVFTHIWQKPLAQFIVSIYGGKKTGDLQFSRTDTVVKPGGLVQSINSYFTSLQRARE